MNTAARLIVLPSAAALLVLAGCKVGPDYQAPPTASPEAWSEPLDGKLTNERADVARWWSSLNDPVLDSLVERAAQTNLDLREVTARVREARAARGVAEAGYYPTINTSGSYTRERTSETLANTPPGAGTGDPFDLFFAGFDATWELDIFGRVSREVEAADADLAALNEARHDVIVTLVSEVARNYTEVRSFQNRLHIAQNNVKAQEETLELTESRFKAGLTSELDVAQARANLEQTRSQIPLLFTGVRQSMHRLEVLLAQRPGTLAKELEAADAGKIPVPPSSVAIGLPSELLLRRPDVRRAEREIAAANARIGVATSDLFPRFTITGSVGLQSGQFGSMFEGDSFAYSVGPSVRWNIFDGNRIRRNIDVQTARQEQALARYEKTVLIAFSDVENALVAFSREQVRRSSLDAAVTAQQRAVNLAEELYKQGLTDFQNVLDAQRQLYSLQDQFAQSERDVTSNLIALYKALGGGWDMPQQPTTTASK